MKNDESKIKVPTDLRFPHKDSKEIAIHECRVFDSGGRIKQVIPAKTSGQVVAQPLRPLDWGDGI